MTSNTILKLSRGLVRPVATLTLVIGFVVAALSPVVFGASVEAATFAVTALGAPTGIIVQKWFDSREHDKWKERDA